MKNSLKEYVEGRKSKTRNRIKVTAILLVLSLAVITAVVWRLRLPGATLDDTVYCGYEEHTHDASCTKQTLKCLVSEHSHTDECYELERILDCTEDHEHTDECYKDSRSLKCELSEHEHTQECYEYSYTCGKTEHTHSLGCYSNVNADVETEEDWTATLPKLEQFTGNVSLDIVAVAESQLGYAESKENYKVDEEGNVKGYSRYGAWYGDSYADWNAMFVSFCLYYAGVPESAVPYSADVQAWQAELESKELYANAVGYEPQVGNIVFFDNDKDGFADGVGIVTQLAENEIKTVEGVTGDKVTQKTYNTNDVAILGYCYMPVTLNTTPVGSASGIDFTNWITDITLKQKQYDWNDWQQVNNGNIKNDYKLRFDINYTMPGGVLNDDNKTIVYQLPDNFSFDSVEGENTEIDSGKVYNNSGQEVGTYVILKDGSVAITFNDDSVAKNGSGQAIVGTISFNADANDIQTDDKGDASLKFSEDVSLDIHIEDKTVETDDLTVEKRAVTVDVEAGTVQYQIRVTSENGTASDVVLNDTMHRLVTDGEITVTGAGDNYTVNKTDTRFDITLPQMSAGDEYIITYTAKLKDIYNGTQIVQNDVVANSTRADGAKLSDSATVKTDVKCEYVTKKGELSSDGKKVNWTIVVNKDKVDIGGWTLSDNLNGRDFNGTVGISPAVNGEDTITLPYTFPEGTKDIYTITYETDAEMEVGKWGITNVAYLKKDNHSLQYGANVGGNGTQYNPLHKHSAGIDNAKTTDDTIEIKWESIINAERGSIPATWVYTDTLKDGQWFTSEQLKNIKASLEKAIADEGLKLEYTMKVNLLEGSDNLGQEIAFDEITDDGKYKSYKFVFTTALEMGKSFGYTYSSTASINNVTLPKTYRNEANIDDKVYSSGEFTYKSGEPTITKTDLNATGGNTTHNYYDDNLKSGDENGFMKWQLKIVVPDGYSDGAITVKEHLPDGVELKKLSIQANEVLGWERDITASQTYNISYNEQDYDIVKSQDGQVILIALPENMVQNTSLYEILLNVTVKISDSFDWSKSDTHEFHNLVQLVDKNNKTVAGDEQTQTITHTKAYTVKSCPEPYYIVDNVIPYSIVINPDGKDVSKDSDTLVINDVMEYSYDADSVSYNVVLVPGSLKAYYLNADGSKGDELGNDKISYLYSEGDNGETGWGKKNWRKLVINVPDATPLILEYRYLVVGSVSAGSKLNNTAVIEGVDDSSTTGASSSKSIWFNIRESSATANMGGIIIYKVDSENNALMLEGAEFELYRWDSQTGEYVIVSDKNGNTTLKTDEDGELSLTELAFNTAYKLKEIKAPPGYILSQKEYSFLIKNDNVTDNPECKPDDFNGEIKVGGDIIYYPNISDSTSITIEKAWQDINGLKSEDTPEEITVEIWQKNPLTGESVKYKTCTLTKQSDWSLTEKLLPKSIWSESGDIIGQYLYYVKETADENKYEVIYENNDGISAGTVKITNKEKRVYKLPQSGGIGTHRYALMGVLFIIIALTAAFSLHMYRRKILKIKKENEL